MNEEGYEVIGSANRDGNRSYGAMEKVNRRPRSDTDASVDWQGEKSYEVTELCTKVRQTTLCGILNFTAAFAS